MCEQIADPLCVAASPGSVAIQNVVLEPNSDFAADAANRCKTVGLLFAEAAECPINSRRKEVTLQGDAARNFDGAIDAAAVVSTYDVEQLQLILGNDPLVEQSCQMLDI